MSSSALAYIPVDRRLAIAAGEVLPDRTEGTALFADISGFTPLTEALARELGPKRGAEELTRQLDTVYGALIAEVERYRGSVIGFAGDAITCWFDGDSGLRAVGCGLAMQRVMKDFATIATPGGSEVTLAIKVGAAAGPVRRFLVGHPDIQYIDALAGATLERMAAAEHHASKGDVVVGEEIVANLGGEVRVAEWRQEEETGRRFAVLGDQPLMLDADPWPQLLPHALGDEQVRPWVLPVVYERLKSGQGEFLAEIRPAVALFLRFSGIDYDIDEAAGDKLDAYIRWVQGVVARYEGTLIQLTFGDKGSFLYVAFGAPLAHDDDPARAAATALELRSPPPELSYIRPAQIGISRGRARAGAYGGPGCRTYGVLGDEVNLAARLMGKAEPGEILVSRRIVEVTSRHYRFREIGPVSVKGKEAPVLVSALLGRQASAAEGPSGQRGSPLVGRDRELEQVDEVLHSVLEGRGQILRIQGVAGVGKSHLAAELLARAQEHSMKVAVGTCQSTTVGTAYAPWRQIFQSLLEVGEEALPGEEPEEATARQVAALEALVTGMNPDWMLRLPLLGDLLGLPIPDNPTTAAFEPRLRQSALFDLVSDMVQSWAEDQPLLLLFDDVHWMDQASHGLAVAAGRAIAATGVGLALVHRPSLPGESILTELTSLPYHRLLDLNELSPEGVAALVTGRLGGPATPLALSLVQVETQGNPFFVEEVVDSLRELGNLYLRDDGYWALSPQTTDALRRANCLERVAGEWVLAPNISLSAVDLGLPDSIQGVVLSRIDRLPEAHKLTLKVASVIGHTFAVDLLERCHPLKLSEEELNEQLRMFEVRDFARVETPGQRPVYMFKHNVTHDVAYETLLFSQRKQLHCAVAGALEELEPDAVGQLAYHSFTGEDWHRALRYQSLAAEQAQKLFANYEAIEHFSKVLQSAQALQGSNGETAPQQLRAHEGLGELLTSTGQYEPALEHLDQALSLGVELGDADARARACRWIARAHENRGEFPAALDWVERGLEALGARETPARAEMLAIAGLIHSRQGDYEKALQACEQSLEMGRRLEELPVLAFASNLLGHITRVRGNSVGAIEQFEQALDIYRQAGNVGGQAVSHNQIANSYFDKGLWPQADYHYRQARQIFNQIGDVYNQAFVDNNLGGIALNQGRLDEALSFYGESLHALEQIGSSPYVIGVLHMNLGATFVRRGDPDEARLNLEASRERFAQANARDFLPEMHRHLAEAALQAGDLDESEFESMQALSLARELAMRGEEGSSLRVMGEAALNCGNLGEAERQLRESESILEEVEDEYELARTRLSLAKVYRARGRMEQAREALERSTATFQRLEAAIELAEANRLIEA